MSSYEKCPICDSEGEEVYPLDSHYIRKQLASYFQEALPENISITDYTLMRCAKCTLEYATPMKSGSNEFYNWITGHESYYPKTRWEWQIVDNIIKQIPTNIYLLEIGCGAGDFLGIVKSKATIRAIGVDLTKKSIELCNSKKITAYCETIDEYRENEQHKVKHFDYIVSFHTLEHVTDPMGFVASMVKLLKGDGTIFISTPYSPMSFESVWFDPLNHPPHHLTRWNKKAYCELAEQLKMRIEFIVPDYPNLFSRALSSLNLQINGNTENSFHKVLFQSLARPLKFGKELLRQAFFKKDGSKTAADVMLIALKMTGSGA